MYDEKNPIGGMPEEISYTPNAAKKEVSVSLVRLLQCYTCNTPTVTFVTLPLLHL